MEEIEEFVSGTVITELYIENNDYPYYYVGESCLGWAEYIDTSNFDPFELLGFTVKTVRIEVASDFNDEDAEFDFALSNIINKSGESLTTALAKIEALGSHVSINRL